MRNLNLIIVSVFIFLLYIYSYGSYTVNNVFYESFYLIPEVIELPKNPKKIINNPVKVKESKHKNNYSYKVNKSFQNNRYKSNTNFKYRPVY